MTDADGHIIAIGASAGSLSALRDLLGELPRDLNAPVVIAVHSDESSVLSNILQTKSTLDIRELADGDTPRCGRIYVVPGATHAFFRSGQMTLSGLVRDSGFRPSIDALFMTLAAEYREKAIAVVLSGTLNDGMRGSQVVYDMGGRTIVQNPQEAKYESMPMNVIRADHPRQILSAKDLGIWLTETVGRTGETSN